VDEVGGLSVECSGCSSTGSARPGSRDKSLLYAHPHPAKRGGSLESRLRAGDVVADYRCFIIPFNKASRPAPAAPCWRRSGTPQPSS
jgi:hypothetical protein